MGISVCVLLFSSHAYRTMPNEKTQKQNTLIKVELLIWMFALFGPDTLAISCLILTNEMSNERAKSNAETVYFRFLYNC